jgi:gamma-glutamylcyclotransferase (GGCT)/AIG2-like uncharacterized protein YtfP
MEDLLFVYGTLLQNIDNDYARFLKKRSQFIETGSFQGLLYKVSWYPAAIPSENTSDKVFGHILKLKNPPKDFPFLDAYEDYFPNQPSKSLYLRKLCPISTTDGTKKCWIYLWNRSVENLDRIPSGNFLDKTIL